MTTGEEYLNELAGLPPETFASKFAGRATRLHLGTALDATALQSLYEAAFTAALCNSALNGLGSWGGIIEPEQESIRRWLEGDFMVARDKLYACAWWQALPSRVRQRTQRIFLAISVREDNLVAESRRTP
jgi:hypothetical protein